jgi:hypothetical protein
MVLSCLRRYRQWVERAYDGLQAAVAVTEPVTEKARRMDVSIEKRRIEVVALEQTLLEMTRDLNAHRRVCDVPAPSRAPFLNVLPAGD